MAQPGVNTLNEILEQSAPWLLMIKQIMHLPKLWVHKGLM
jgi:hypothetical protein